MVDSFHCHPNCLISLADPSRWHHPSHFAVGSFHRPTKPTHWLTDPSPWPVGSSQRRVSSSHRSDDLSHMNRRNILLLPFQKVVRSRPTCPKRHLLKGKNFHNRTIWNQLKTAWNHLEVADNNLEPP